MALVAATSCMNELDQYPKVETTSASVYTSVSNYRSVLAKIYCSFVTRGQDKAGDNADISSSNRNEDYIRCYFNLQEVPTDEVAYTWLGGDVMSGLTFMTWDINDAWTEDMYYRVYYAITLCNEFIKNSTDGNIGRFTEAEQAEIRGMRNDARFIRAMAYWHAMDLFGRVPFVTENDPIGAFIPAAIERADLFNYIVGELNAIAAELPSRTAVVKGRVSAGAAWALLARVYLNGKVYTGNEYYTQCITCCKNVIADGYSLEGTYSKLFNADNDLRTNEILFSFACDSEHTSTWGGTTYLICGQVSSDYAPYASTYGVTGGWDNFRVLGTFSSKFTNSADVRGNFITSGQTQTVTVMDNKSQGYLSRKWTNLTDAGAQASNTADNGANTDVVVLRLADVYLMLAEAVLRGGTGATRGEALGYVNQLRTRAYNNSAAGNIADGDLTLDFLLDERGRELYFEMIRRTDLIRYGLFTSGSYLWEWKGNFVSGQGVNEKYNLYPIPRSETSANPNIYNNNY